MTSTNVMTSTNAREARARRRAHSAGLHVNKARRARLAGTDAVFFVVDAGTKALLTSEWGLNLEALEGWLATSIASARMR